MRHRPLYLALAAALVTLGCNNDPIDEGVTLENSAPNATSGLKGVGETCFQDQQCQSGSCVSNACATRDPGAPMCQGPPGPCGDCDPTCVPDAQGMGMAEPFDTGADGQGIVTTPDGAITIETGEGASDERFIWISNTAQGTVSRVNTTSLVEEGRYWTGPAGQGNDPSRTSVNSLGDVFVGNRGGGSVTKISSRGANCRDRNDDGVVTTSTGRDDVKGYGEDDCVKWSTPLCNDGCLVRAVAAQDITEGDTVRPVVWAGGFNNNTLWKLDGETGEVLLTTQSPVRPYGFALDKAGNLWISGPNYGFGSERRFFGRVDTNRCVDDASCDVDVCEGEGMESCVKQRIPLDHQPYGLTVDFKQRVWLGGQRIARYNPAAPAGSRLRVVDPGIFIHGIAADEQGRIWASGWIPQVDGNFVVGTADGAVLQIDAENPDQYQRVTGSQGISSKGIAVDFDGKIWSINQFTQDATIIAPGELGASSVSTNVTGFEFPYVYSDMTGAQLRFATDALGFWRRPFTECSPRENYFETRWKELRWQAEVPDPQRSSLVLRVRAANSQLDLDTTEFETVVTLKMDSTSSFDLQPLFEARGWQNAVFVEVEAQFKLEREIDVEPRPPRLLSVTVTKSCPEIVN